jgi:hypothetical protein
MIEQPAKPPFRLVRTVVSRDTVETLETLLDQAKTGSLIGMAFVVMYSGREYIASAVGEAHRNPTFTRGMLRALDEQLGNLL